MFKKINVIITALILVLILTVAGCGAKPTATVPTAPVVQTDPTASAGAKATKADLIGAWLEKANGGVLIFNGTIDKSNNAATYKLAYTDENGNKTVLNGYYDIQDLSNDRYKVTLYNMIMPDVNTPNLAPVKGDAATSFTVKFIDKNNMETVAEGSSDIASLSRMKLDEAEAMVAAH